MLKKIRLERGLHQKQLAEKSGVSYRMIRCYEDGSRKIEKAEFGTVLKLAVALDVPVSSILTDPNTIELCGRTRL